jgi:membrane protease YdiL (CAAX protease family)
MPSSSSSRTLFLILGFVAGVLVGGAILAPVLFFSAKAVMQASPEGWMAQALGEKTFPSYFNRAALLAAAIGLVPVLRALRVSWRQVLGDVPFTTGWKQMLSSFLFAAVLLVPLALIACWVGAVRLKADPAWVALFKPLLSGWTVAVIEEILFRGAVLVILCRTLGNRSGLWWTTGIFALVHFLKPPLDDALPDAAVTWSSGFWVITQLFRGFGAWTTFAGEFLFLAMVGWVLARARLATGGLWVSIGLHAGWVAGMKHVSQLMHRAGALDRGDFDPWFVRNTCRAIVSPFVGVIPLIGVLLTGLTVLMLVEKYWPRTAQSPTGNPASPPSL